MSWCIFAVAVLGQSLHRSSVNLSSSNHTTILSRSNMESQKSEMSIPCCILKKRLYTSDTSILYIYIYTVYMLVYVQRLRHL